MEKQIINRYQKVWNVAIGLRNELRDGGKNYGFFEHILNHLCFTKTALIEGEREATPSEREKFRQRIRAIRTYRKLLENHPEFKKGELGQGYFDVDERRPRDADGNKRWIHDPVEYVEYARKELEGN